MNLAAIFKFTVFYRFPPSKLRLVFEVLRVMNLINRNLSRVAFNRWKTVRYGELSFRGEKVLLLFTFKTKMFTNELKFSDLTKMLEAVSSASDTKKRYKFVSEYFSKLQTFQKEFKKKNGNKVSKGKFRIEWNKDESEQGG